MTETLLCELARKYGTDKGGHHGKYGSGRCHNYTPHYFEMWNARRDELLTILEIGAQHGHSIQMWHEFFPNAKVYGLDCDVSQYAYLLDPQIDIIEADTRESASLQVAMDKIGCPKFDFIVDDGNHRDGDQQTNLDFFLPYLKADGVYCVEDNDTVEPGDVFVKVPDGYTLEVTDNRVPHHDSLLQIIRRNPL